MLPQAARHEPHVFCACGSFSVGAACICSRQTLWSNGTGRLTRQRRSPTTRRTCPLGGGVSLHSTLLRPPSSTFAECEGGGQGIRAVLNYSCGGLLSNIPPSSTGLIAKRAKEMQGACAAPYDRPPAQKKIERQSRHGQPLRLRPGLLGEWHSDKTGGRLHFCPVCFQLKERAAACCSE